MPPTQTKRATLTLGRLFAAALAGLLILLGLLFFLLLAGSKRSILQISEQMRSTASRQIAERVSDYLFQANASLDDVTAQIRRRVFDPHDQPAIEAALYAQLLAHENLDQLSVTYARNIGFDADGRMMLGPDGRGQVAVFRQESDGSGASITTRRISGKDKDFTEQLRHRSPGGTFDSGAFVAAPGLVSDPTDVLTFRSLARRSNYGNAVWTDLYWRDRDMALPPAQRRVLVSIQRTIEDADGHFVGVLQVGLLTRQLDRIAQFKLNPADPHDPHQVFLCDRFGGLISRVTPQDHIAEVGDDLRFVSPGLPPEVAAALKQPELKKLAGPGAAWSGPIIVNGRRFLLTFRGLDRTQDWIVGIVVPEAYYLGSLEQVRNRLLIASLLVMVCILLGGVVTLRMIRHGFRRITEQTTRMQAFTFSPSPPPPETRLDEVRQVLFQIESAKTALRAMGKYVPVDLVRQLYERNAEPMLGGELLQLTVMFTDIRRFTDLAEALEPNRLATALGHYMQAMTDAIQAHRGVIDKFIGDAVMALWNAPRTVADHPINACAAALACVEATTRLFQSPAWHGLPPLVTRFGIHTDRVLVGHFGAPSRMNFTAIGDGVNTAARLESLNKHYGTTLLVSGNVCEQAKSRFCFRRLDRVTVVGKSQCIEVYELLGLAGEKARRPAMEVYERALEAYFQRQFTEALNGFESCPGDEASVVMAERCRVFVKNPPPAAWDGTHVWLMK